MNLVMADSSYYVKVSPEIHYIYKYIERVKGGREREREREKGGRVCVQVSDSEILYLCKTPQRRNPCCDS